MLAGLAGKQLKSTLARTIKLVVKVKIDLAENAVAKHRRSNCPETHPRLLDAP